MTIVTKHLKATNTLGTRVKATDEWGTITIGWDYSLDEDENHRVVATVLAGAPVKFQGISNDMRRYWSVPVGTEMRDIAQRVAEVAEAIRSAR